MKSKKYTIISCVLASIAFSSIFFFDSKGNTLINEIHIVEKQIKKIYFNLEGSEKNYEASRNLRSQIDILSALKVDVSLREEEQLELLIVSAAQTVAVVKDLKKEPVNHENISNKLTHEIVSHETYLKRYKSSMDIIFEYLNGKEDKIAVMRKQIEEINFWKSIVLVFAIVANTLALVLNGITVNTKHEITEEGLTKNVEGLVSRVNLLIKKINKTTSHHK